MQKYITKNGRKLKKGYTTGICAAAASKACALMLLTGKDMDKIHMKWSFGRILLSDSYRLLLKI